MKLNPISALVCLSFGSLAGAAFALPISQYQSTPGDTAELYISGATAQENGLRNTLARMCTVGSLDIYQDASSPLQQAAFCTINKAVVTGAIPASVTKMAVYKSGVGGSGNGVGPVANASQLAFVNMALLKASATGAPAVSYLGTGTNVIAVAAVAPNAPDTIGIPAYTRTNIVLPASTSPAFTQSVVTEAGFSDVEPALLGASSLQTSRLTIVAPNVLTFGVPVTVVARNALQAAQGLPVGDETELSMPSLRLDLIRSLYTGNITNWSQLGATIPGVGADPSLDTIYLATRVETSGTQRSFNVYVTGSACTANVQAVLLNNSSAADCAAASPAGTVFAGSSSSNVTTCLAGHQGRGRGAAGVLSMEFVPGTASGGSGYRYIKIDDYAPTTVNVVNGDYDFWVEPTFQYRQVAVSAVPALGGDKRIIADRIVQQLGTEAVISSLNNSFVQTWGRSGLLAKPSGTNAPNVIVPRTTAAAVLANPTNAFTKSPSGQPVNCQPGVFFN